MLSTGEDLETAINVDEVLRYFTVQVFVMNWDSYLGHTGHNYFLYEEDGVISILPWDYNLAFGTYALGMTDPIRDPDVLINWPINTPARGETMLKRPLYHNLMKNNDYFARYHAYFDHLLTEYFESGRYEAVIRQTQAMIAPYVQADPTAFCSYEDHLLAVDTLLEVCRLRSESVRGTVGRRLSRHPWPSRSRNRGRGWTPPMWICGPWGISTTWRPQRRGRMRPRAWWE